MNAGPAPTLQAPRRRWPAIIAIALATGIACLIVAYLLVSRIDILPVSPGKSAQTLAMTTATYNPHSMQATDAAPTLPEPQSQSTTASAWKAIMDNLEMLLKGDKVEVCGLSDFDAALFLAGDNEVGTRAANGALAQMTSKLVESKDAHEHMLGLYMQAHLAEWATNRAESSKYRICVGDVDCVLKLLSANERAYALPEPKATTAAPLVTLAIASEDPDHIAAAIYACAGSVAGACGSITATDWARIEPNNAAAWLKVADAALFRNDTAARNSALRRAAVASDYDMRVPSFAALADSSLLKSQTVLVQASIGESLAGLTITASLPPIYAAARYCLHEKDIDAARNTLCDKIANTLSEKDDSVIGLVMATAIGAKVGWDAARLQALRDEKAVATGLLYGAAPEGDRFSCKQLARDNNFISNALAKGERANGRERVASSGKTLAELAEQYRNTYPDLAK